MGHSDILVCHIEETYKSAGLPHFKICSKAKQTNYLYLIMFVFSTTYLFNILKI